MDLNGYLALLDAEASTLATVAEQAGPDAPVLTCPGWTIADLVLHLGEVHRWATAVVASGAIKLGDVPADFLGPLPEPGDAVAWFRAGAAKLCETIANADQSIDYATFLNDPPSPRLLFWARRQTMETAMHRVDAESAVGRRTAFTPEAALDGIDEFLTGFLPRSRSPLHSDVPRTLAIAPDYSDRRWIVSIGPDAPSTQRDPAGSPVDGDADCVISGSASDIYLALWNRCSVDDLCVTGDRSVMDLLRDKVQIRWG